MDDFKIYIISGKARHGKDTTGQMIKDYYLKKNKKVIILQYSFYIKEYAKRITGWNGSDDNKPRTLLQTLSLDIINKEIGSDFLVKRMIDDILVYSHFFDRIIITDARTKLEIDALKMKFKNVTSLRINRINFDNQLTLEQKKHFTEIALDDYDKFDFYVLNDGTLDDLKIKVHSILDEVENEKNDK